MRKSSIELSSYPTRFTLVEMLVVAAIISILFSILQPALLESINQAKSLKCKNNLKQIGTCISMYTMDNNNWLPAVFDGGRLWFQTFPQDYILGQQGSIISDSDWVTVCPTYKAMKQNGNYGLSSLWFRVPNWTQATFGYKRVTAIKTASKTFLAGDVEYEGTNVNSSEQYMTGVSWGNHDFRHSVALNSLMADGHMESILVLLPTDAANVFWSGH